MGDVPCLNAPLSHKTTKLVSARVNSAGFSSAKRAHRGLVRIHFKSNSKKGIKQPVHKQTNKMIKFGPHASKTAKPFLFKAGGEDIWEKVRGGRRGLSDTQLTHKQCETQRAKNANKFAPTRQNLRGRSQRLFFAFFSNFC